MQMTRSSIIDHKIITGIANNSNKYNKVIIYSLVSNPFSYIANATQNSNKLYFENNWLVQCIE
jgi:hypothetical protein